MLVNTPGALTLEGGTGMCFGHDPFFQASRCSLNLPSMRRSCAPPPHHLNFKKILHFQPCFGQDFSSQDANFQMFVPNTPTCFLFCFFVFFKGKPTSYALHLETFCIFSLVLARISALKTQISKCSFPIPLLVFCFFFLFCFFFCFFLKENLLPTPYI